MFGSAVVKMKKTGRAAQSSLNTAHHNQGQEHLCGKCERQVADDHEAVQCEVCELWFHIVCEKIPYQVYAYMQDEDTGAQVSWFCIYCKRGCTMLQKRIKKLKMNKMKWSKDRVFWKFW